LTDALVDLVTEEPGLTFVGAARNGAEAISLTIARRPDLFLVDLEAIDVNAAWIARETRRYVPHSRLVALSTYSDTASVRRTLTAGFHRHVSKGDELAYLLSILLEDHVFLA
jgi:DNA-binding NarL/FixJ family response regulator